MKLFVIISHQYKGSFETKKGIIQRIANSYGIENYRRDFS